MTMPHTLPLPAGPLRAPPPVLTHQPTQTEQREQRVQRRWKLGLWVLPAAGAHGACVEGTRNEGARRAGIARRWPLS